MISLANMLAADDVKALLDKHGGGNYGPDVQRFFPRERALAIIHAAIWGHGCRDDSTAGAYAALGLYEALGLKAWTFDDDEAEALQRYRREKAAAGRKPMPDLGRAALSDNRSQTKGE